MSMLIKYTGNIEEVKYFNSSLEFRYFLLENIERDYLKVIGYKRVNNK